MARYQSDHAGGNVALSRISRFRAERVAFAVVMAAALLSGRADHSRAATFTVSNTNDDENDGSLRKAILDGNASPGSTINLRIPTPTVTGAIVTIFVNTPLPVIVAPVTIDGTSQDGSTAGHPVVEVRGRLVLDPATDLDKPVDKGLVFQTGSDGSVVQASRSPDSLRPSSCRATAAPSTTTGSALAPTSPAGPTTPACWCQAAATSSAATR